MTHGQRALSLGASLAIFALACGSEQRPEGETETETETETEAQSGNETNPETASAPGPSTDEPERSCDELALAAASSLATVFEAHGECRFDTQCVAADIASDCYAPCDIALHPRGLVALREAQAAFDEELCPAFAAAACPPVTPECARSTPRCTSGRCAMDQGDAPLRQMPIPEENAARLSDSAPPRPSPGDAEEERGRRLFDAIVHDDPARIGDFFFPREAFAEVKAIADPDGYWQRLFRRFGRDIHELHEALEEEHGDLTHARFGRLDIIRRGGWVPLREEGNALPYWVSRHSQLYYTVDGEERHFEVRVLITWGDRWYVTHLKEFH